MNVLLPFTGKWRPCGGPGGGGGNLLRVVLYENLFAFFSNNHLLVKVEYDLWNSNTISCKVLGQYPQEM
jgi:hypothetical protein